MTAAQLTAIHALLDRLKELDINQKLSVFYANKDIETEKINQFTIPEFIATIKRVVSQLDNELGDNGYFLPHQFNAQSELGAINIHSDLNSLIANLSINPLAQQHINAVASALNKLIFYQISCGFWDKSNKKLHKADEVKIKELQDQLIFIAEKLKKDSETIKVCIDTLSTEKTKLTQFIAQKNQELQQIANNLQTTNTTNQQVNGLFTTSTATNEKINSILKQQESNLESQKKKIEDQIKIFEGQTNSYTTLETKIKESITTLEKQVAEYTTHLTFVESKTEYFHERNQYLDNLIGREVGASLFETFKQRKGELNKPVNKWLWIVIGTSILTFIAVLAIFTNGFGLIGDIPELTWQWVLTNSLKSSPFFFLLFYSISQYNKERHYQEEYAFKSAVALTIKAYADIIEKQEIKDELIVTSLAEVYKTPHPDNKKRSKYDRSIVETATGLANTALDVLKKN